MCAPAEPTTVFVNAVMPRGPIEAKVHPLGGVGNVVVVVVGTGVVVGVVVVSDGFVVVAGVATGVEALQALSKAPLSTKAPRIRLTKHR